MSWQTIIVCDACYRVRADTDDRLVDRPVRLIDEYAETCHDCGSPGARVPIRANINPGKE